MLGGRGLRPVKKGGGSFDKVVDQTLSIFTSPIFYWAHYTLNKTFSLEGKEAQNGEGNLSQKLGRGTSAQKLGGKLHPILIPDLGE